MNDLEVEYGVKHAYENWWKIDDHRTFGTVTEALEHIATSPKPEEWSVVKRLVSDWEYA